MSALDWHFAHATAALAEGTGSEVLLAAALVSRALSQGHVCLDLGRSLDHLVVAERDASLPAINWPEGLGWIEALRASALVGAAESGDEADSAARPLVLDGQRLYTRRYWVYERELAENLIARSIDVAPVFDDALLSDRLVRLFGPPSDEADRQRVAAVVALTRGLSVITGGPGTGKTSTVANLLVLLAEEERQRRGRLPDVLVLAPTGKAANRLSHSLADSAAKLDCDDEVRGLVATKAATIHRALGRDMRSRTRFRHDAQHPLRSDVVVVDEASMVDIALMVKLLSAVPRQARVILLGDRDQLASVEAGAILADLCGETGGRGYSPEAAARIERLCGLRVPILSDLPVIGDSIVHLRRNFRYGEHSSIGQLAAAINAGDEDSVIEILADQERCDVSLRPCLAGDAALSAEVAATLSPLFEESEPIEKLASLSRHRILCALRRGPLGVEGLNRQIESHLRGAGWIDGDSESYPGRPIMISSNDRETGLFNGDVGLLSGGDSGRLCAYFPEGAGARSVSMARLPAYETVYAMTIHKSQGSEFEEVAIILPDRPSPLLTRELLYTAVTRARSKVTIHADSDILRRAIRQRVERSSGLAERLGWR